MKKKNFRSFDHFKSEVLFDRAGPLSSAVEEVADEMYNHDISEEFDNLWDAPDGGDDE